MRIDKYLKVSRIVKRRSVAKEISDNGRVEINNKIVKSSSTVAVNDIIKIHFGNKEVTVKVKELLNSTKKEDANLMYELINEDRNA